MAFLFEKSQLVRMLDVLLLGPFLLWYALRYDYSTKKDERVKPVWKTILLIAGFYTIVYNAYNFLGNYVELYPLP